MFTTFYSLQFILYNYIPHNSIAITFTTFYSLQLYSLHFIHYNYAYVQYILFKKI